MKSAEVKERAEQLLVVFFLTEEMLSHLQPLHLILQCTATSHA